ncbi:PTS cellobiose transporter subunit IIC [uncultured Clostridium sp.]|uniref:PTS cellobiose transporter subunit IIC n=1 Tax=uncultured Clostridium sp. TaxID=59620 RepID=UPI00338E9F81
MNSIMKKFENILMPMAEVIGRNKYLIAIRDGFLVSTPLLIVGSLFLLVANFPIPGWNEWVGQFLGEGWASKLTTPVAATFDIMAILAIVGIAYSLARQLEVDAIQASATALVAFFIVTPYKIDFTPKGEEVSHIVKGIPLDWVGSKGLFLGMIVALTSVVIFAKVLKKGWVIKLPAGVPPTVAKSFEALIPAGIVIVVFFLVNYIFSYTAYETVHNFVFKILQVPLLKLGNTLPAMVIAYLFLHGFWFFGINGSSVVGAVFNPVLKALSVENLEAFQAGQPIPNIITGQFQDMFATFGGAGSTLSLLIAIILVCKSQRVTKMGKLSLLPGIFGINEPIIFGLPIMLNPMILIPFMVIPTVNIIISYFAMAGGFVPFTNGVQIPWTTPPVISGFLVSGWQGSVLQIILIVLGVIMYIPFIKAIDNQYLKEETEASNSQEDDDDIDFDDLDL